MTSAYWVVCLKEIPMVKRFRDEDFLLKVGARIKSIRTARGFSIEAVYLKCAGLNRSSLSRIERGLTDPQVSTLKRIADTLDVPLTDFLDNLENPPFAVVSPLVSN